MAPFVDEDSEERCKDAFRRRRGPRAHRSHPGCELRRTVPCPAASAAHRRPFGLVQCLSPFRSHKMLGLTCPRSETCTQTSTFVHLEVRATERLGAPPASVRASRADRLTRAACLAEHRAALPRTSRPLCSGRHDDGRKCSKTCMNAAGGRQRASEPSKQL